MSKSNFYCGAAVRSITPSEDMLPLPLLGAVDSIISVQDPIHVRSLALSDGETDALFLSFELLYVPRPEQMTKKLSQALKLPQECIFLAATHAHATPMVDMTWPDGTQIEMPDDLRDRLEQYLDFVHREAVSAAEEALQGRRPARLCLAYGKSYININRTRDFFIHGELTEMQERMAGMCGKSEDGKRITTIGLDPEGVSDKTLAVVSFIDEDSKPIAFLVNYAVHAVVMHMNPQKALSSDIPGIVSAGIEKEYPGTVAIWTSAAAGDQNPIMMGYKYAPMTENGFMAPAEICKDPAFLLDMMAWTHFDDILRTLPKSQAVEGDMTIRFAKAFAQPERADPDVPCDIEMSLLRVGPLAFVGIHGELFTSIGQSLIEASNAPYTLVVTHCGTTNGRVGYILDDDALSRGAFGTRDTRGRIGTIEPAMIETMQKMFCQAEV